MKMFKKYALSMVVALLVSAQSFASTQPSGDDYFTYEGDFGFDSDKAERFLDAVQVMNVRDYELKRDDAFDERLDKEVAFVEASREAESAPVAEQEVHVAAAYAEQVQYRQVMPVCRWCSKVCDTQYQLTMHERTHTGEKPFECGECKKRFTQKSNLTTHVRRMHAEEPQPSLGMAKNSGQQRGKKRKNECSECGKNFTQKVNLETHVRTHSGERPYKCDMCGNDFADKSNYNRHVRRHTGEKRTSAILVEKAFCGAIN